MRALEYKKRKGDYHLLPNGKLLFNMNSDKDPRLTILLPVITENIDFTPTGTPHMRGCPGKFWISKKGHRCFTPYEGNDKLCVITYPISASVPEVLSCANVQYLNSWNSGEFTHVWFILKGEEAA